MSKEKVISRICDGGLVAVVRAENGEQAKKIADACIAGGVAAIEITFTVPGAVGVLEELAKTYTDQQIILGAGTVLDSETARTAMLSGAKYVVTPCLNTDTVEICNRYGIPCMPGAMTIKEIVEGMEAGADIIKIFPGEIFGPSFIKAIKGPLPHAKLMPTGGVSVNNVTEWIKAGCVAVGAGSSLIAGAKTGEYHLITETAQQFVKLIKHARSDG